MAIPFESRPSGRLIAKKAWLSVFEAWGKMTPLFLSALALSLVLGFATFYGPNSLWLLSQSQKHGSGNYAAYVVIQAGFTLAWTFVAAPVAVAMHRFILMGKITTGVLSFSPHYIRAFFLWAAGLKLATLMLNMLTDLFSGLSVAAGALIGAALGVMNLVVLVYLAMIFPAVATEVEAEHWRMRIIRSAQQIRGSFWLVVRSAILAFVPLAIIYMTFWILFGGLHASLSKGDLRESFRLGLAVLTGAFGVFGFMLGAAVASWLYAWVGQKSAGEAIS